MAENIPEYICDSDGCSKSFKTRGGKWKHMQTCNGRVREDQAVEKEYTKDETGRICCRKCSKSFSQLVNFYRHNKDIHVNPKVCVEKKTYLCVVCSKVFEKESKLLQHMQTHSKTIYKCGTCSKAYIRSDHYEAHIKVCNGENARGGARNDGVDMGEWANSLLRMLPTNEREQLRNREEGLAENELVHENVLVHDNELIPDNDFVRENEWVHENDFVRENDDFVRENNDFVQENALVPELVPENEVIRVIEQVVSGCEHEEEILVVEQEEMPAVEEEVIPVSRMWENRKVRKLSSALETIQRLQIQDQASILRKAVNQTDMQGIETIFMSDTENLNEAKLTNGLISYLKRFHMHHREEKNHFCSLLWGVCGDSLMNEDFVYWLSNKLGMRKDRLSHHIRTWLSVTTEPVESRGRKGLSPETKQAIYDGWHTYSMVTVDCRSGRDQVVMRKDRFLQKFGQLQTPNDIVIEEFNSKRNQDMVRTTRRISTKTFKEMKELLKTKHDIDVSIGSIAKFKPYYMQTTTEREKESCLCKFCLNYRLKFKALLKHLKDGVDSTESD